MTPITALALFGLVTALIYTIDIFYTYGTRGFGFGFSSNRPVLEKSGLALRVERVTRNQAESTAYILPALGAAALTGLSGGLVSTLCLLIVVGRLGFAALYYTGLPMARIPFFSMATFSSVILLVFAVQAQMA